MKRLNLDIDKNLTANSNILAPSQQALKYYIDQKRVLLNYLQETEPTSFSVGEKWLNTSSNKIFTALSSSTWDNGIDLELGQIYSFNNLLYHWDGENLLIYSSGSITETHNNTEVKTWVGTQSEYDAIATKDPTTEYVITDAYSNLDIILANQTEFNNSSTTKAATPYQVNQKIGNYLPLAGGNLNAGAILRLTNTNNEVTPLAFNTSGYLTVGSKLYVNTETNTNTVVVRSGNIYKVNTSGATAIWSDEKGANNGIATLNSSGLVTSTQLPTATVSNLGLVQPDGNTITIDANGVITAIGGGGGGGDVVVDNSTIIKNNDSSITAIALREQRNSQAIKEWVGTKAQYDALNSKDSNTKYIITDDEGTGIVIDSVLSNTSTNPVQNSTITNAIQNMAVAKTRIVGEIVESTIPLTDAGLHLLDGSVIIGNGVYSEFVTYMAGLVNTHPEIFTTETDWQNSVSEFGVCNKYVYDSQENAIRLPNISTANRYLIYSYKNGSSWYNIYSDGWCEQGSSRPAISGDASATIDLLIEFADTNYQVFDMAFASNKTGNSRAGCMLGTRTTTNFVLWQDTYTDEGGVWEAKGYIDTTNLALNQIYEYVVIATTSNTQVEVDINEIISDLNTKVSTGDLDEVQCIVETYSNGSSWYNVYSNGWCEQGGKVTTASHQYGSTTISLLKQMVDTNYNITLGGRNTTENGNYVFTVGSSVTTSSFDIWDERTTGGNHENECYWRVSGYII